MSQFVDSIRFSSSADSSAWPQISSPGANQLSVANCDMLLDAGRKLNFPGDAPSSVTGDLVVLTGAPTAKERLRVRADGDVSIGTPAANARLEVHGDLTVSGLINGSDIAAERQKVKVLQGQVQAIVPIGTVVLFGGDTPPTGWLRCDGTILPKTLYPQLAEILGYRFGGNESSTFGLPRLVGRFPLGAGGGHTAGMSGGSETQNLSVAQIPGHTHSGTTREANKADFRVVHKAGSNILINHVNGWDGAEGFHDVTQSYVPGGIHTHNLTTDSGLGCAGQAFSIMPPFLVLHYIIKAT
jgi:microcystin-dependent protein